MKTQQEQLAKIKKKQIHFEQTFNRKCFIVCSCKQCHSRTDKWSFRHQRWHIVMVIYETLNKSGIPGVLFFAIPHKYHEQR
jgi:hypothetical protein